MNHLPILPILIAAFSGFVLTLLSQSELRLQRTVGVLGTLAGLAAALWGLAVVADGQPMVYELGDWPAPFGIVLVLDRLSALMVLLTAVTATLALGAALHDADRRGRMFHALFQFQLMGIYGAFLTGDIFNLFVFFEILLLASYGLLLHGGGAERSRAAVKYVAVNLTGSAFFLIGVGTLYGVTGTLNMADLALRVPEVAEADRGLLHISAFMLLVVFGTKAALIPLFLWLPDTYSRASAPVAALFAIMTKIGVYAILRVFTISFGAPGSELAEALGPWLLGAAGATLLAGMLGALAATELRRLVAYLVIASVGSLLIAVGVFSTQSIAAALYYLIQSTLVAAALFLMADAIARQRGAAGDELRPGPMPGHWATLGILFMLLAMAGVGMPPLSGFLGKALILKAVWSHPGAALWWTLILATSLLAVVALGRAGSTLFWKTQGEAPNPSAALPREQLLALLAGTGLIVAVSVLAGPVERFAQRTAADLVQPQVYIDTVLGPAAR